MISVLVHVCVVMLSWSLFKKYHGFCKSFVHVYSFLIIMLYMCMYICTCQILFNRIIRKSYFTIALILLLCKCFDSATFVCELCSKASLENLCVFCSVCAIRKARGLCKSFLLVHVMSKMTKVLFAQLPVPEAYMYLGTDGL